MPTGTTSTPISHSFEAPPFERATVLDAMRLGVVSCPPDTTLREVARIMATYRIHSVVVTDVEPRADLVRVHAGELAADVTVQAAADLELVPGSRVTFTVKATEVAVYGI